VEVVQHQFHADEHEDRCEPGREVHEPVEETRDEEEERAQPKEGEGVRDEDDVGLLGDPDDRGDGVEREEDVGGADRDEDKGERRDDAAAFSRVTSRPPS
jgi:hypothetical protein